MALADLILSYISDPLPHYLTHYVKGVSPLSTTPVVFSAMAMYLTTIFSIRAIMKNHAPFKLTFLFQAHNLVLSTGSALLLVLILEEILPIWWDRGFFLAICHYRSWTPVRIFPIYPPVFSPVLSVQFDCLNSDSNFTT